MHILIITDSYPPELRSSSGLMAELAEGLSAKGHEVTVATTFPGYNLAEGTEKREIPPEEIRNGVRVLRVEVPSHHKVPNIIRGINQVFFLPPIFMRGVQRLVAGPFDTVIVHSPPLPLALAAAKLARAYNARFIGNIHDIFPQNGIDLVSFWQKPLIQLFFGWMERAVYQKADLLVVPSENHARYLFEKRNVAQAKLRVVPHWVGIPAPLESGENRFRKEWGLTNKFIFFFGGVLGPSQGLEMVVDAAEAFRNEPDVAFLFAGDGTAKQRLERIVSEKKLQNVVFKPFVGSKEYQELLKEVDIGIATLTPKNTTPAVPAKLMAYMASALPVVVAVHKESDALRIVAEAKCGFTALSSDKEAVAAAFRSAYAARASLKELGENGFRYAKEHFDKGKIIGAWESILRIT